jgi:hypothetical protein
LVVVATSCRQPASLHYAGSAKALAVAHQIMARHPYPSLTAWLDRIGGVARPRRTGPDWHRRVETSLACDDLVIDCTAAPAVSRYLAAVARAAGRPFLHASATTGAWGGVVVRLGPDGACWTCLEHHRADGHLPLPPADPEGSVHLAGCGSRTFTGSSADLGHVSLHAVRAATDVLTDRQPVDAAVYTLSLRDAQGRPIPARWQTHRLTPHRACLNHRATSPAAPDGMPRTDPPHTPRTGRNLENSTEATHDNARWTRGRS